MIKEAVSRARSLKIRHILYGFWVFIFIITLRLFYLQVEKKVVFASLGERNFLRTEIIPPLRGDVYDCRHVLLAANRPVFDLYWRGPGKVGLSEEDRDILQKVGNVMGDNFLEGSIHQSLEYASRYARRILLKEDVSFDQLCQISEQCAGAEHLIVSNRFKRVYPYQALASHVLGYLNRNENIGQAGVEHQFESELQGREGYITHIINSTGKALSQKAYKQAQAGADIVLTLDLKLQRLAQSLFAPEQSGSFILMDPDSGAIRALVSYPHFDPNLFLRPISEEEWSNLSHNNPLINRATCALYPPASLFKLVTFAAGLDEKIIDFGSEIQCNGYTTFCGRKYFCMQHLGHGKLTAKRALAVSCNIPCYQIAKKLKIDCLANYAQRFGLGKKTNFLLPEKVGLVPTAAWKKRVKGERWWTGEMLSTCIGQSYLLVTPLQIVRMFSAIASGYLTRPRLLESEQIEKEPLMISHETLVFLRGAIKDAVIDGSARVLSYLPSSAQFDVYVKTGTAQTCSLYKEKLNRQHFEHAWVAGYFSYKGKKPLAIVMMLEHSGHSREALRITDKFLRGYKTLMESEHA